MKNIKKQFVTYEIALAMKELGFNKLCFGYYNPDEELIYGIDLKTMRYAHKYHNEGESVLAPLWQQCMDWLKEKHGIFVFIDMRKYYDSYEGAYPFQAWCKIYKNKELINSITVRNKLDNENFIFYSYEEAREQAILKCIELCKNK